MPWRTARKPGFIFKCIEVSLDVRTELNARFSVVLELILFPFVVAMRFVRLPVFIGILRKHLAAAFQKRGCVDALHRNHRILDLH